MSNVKIVLNRAGVSELLKSQAMMDICTELANDMAGRLGDGHTVNSFVGFDRAHAVVTAESEKAIADNLDNNTLLKEMHG